MTQENMQKKLSELGNNAEFAAKLATCESIEDMVGVFHSEGIDVDAEMLEAALKTVAASYFQRCALLWGAVLLSILAVTGY